MLTKHCSVNGTSRVCLWGRALSQTRGLFKPKPTERSAYCSHYSAKRGMWVCVCVCVCVCSPTPSSNLTSLPSFSFLFHTLSAVLTHSSWAGPKSGRAALQSGTPVLKLTQSAAGTLKNPFREPFLFSSVEETWRWFIRRFIVYHSMDYPICSPHTKVTITVFLFLFVCFY